MIEIDTVRQLLEAGYSVSTTCETCWTHYGKVDLRLLVQHGRGDERPIRLGLECPKCRVRLGLTIHPPGGPGSGGRPDFLTQRVPAVLKDNCDDSHESIVTAGASSAVIEERGHEPGKS
jgi:hypothetical protein